MDSSNSNNDGDAEMNEVPIEVGRYKEELIIDRLGVIMMIMMLMLMMMKDLIHTVVSYYFFSSMVLHVLYRSYQYSIIIIIIIIIIIVVTTVIFHHHIIQQSYSIEDFINAVRFGSRAHVAFLLGKDKSLLNKIGDDVM
jgi:cell division protein FtsW (lipid II flippase)